MKRVSTLVAVALLLSLAFLIPPRVAVIRLDTTDASDAAKMVADVCGPAAVVVAVPIGGSRLLVIGSPKVVKDVATLLREVDLRE